MILRRNLIQVRIVQLGQKKQFKEETAAAAASEKERSEKIGQEEEEEVEAVEKEENKGLELQQMRSGERREKRRRGREAATKRQKKVEMAEQCLVRGRADWIDGRLCFLVVCLFVFPLFVSLFVNLSFVSLEGSLFRT